MKRIFSVVLIFMMVLSIAGCGAKEEEAAAPPAESQNVEVAEADGELSGEIIVWSWDVAAKSLEDAAVRFNEVHPGVTVTVEDLGTGQVYDKLITRLASKTGLPDVVTMEGERVGTFAGKFPDGFADLTEYVNPDDFLAVKISEVSSNGKIIGFPWDGATTGLFYSSRFLS